LGIEVILEIFSKKGVTEIFNVKPENLSENAQRIFALKEEYIKTIDEVIAFLQNKKPTLAREDSWQRKRGCDTERGNRQAGEHS
jgi:hypothetical protein